MVKSSSILGINKAITFKRHLLAGDGDLQSLIYDMIRYTLAAGNPGRKQLSK